MSILEADSTAWTAVRLLLAATLLGATVASAGTALAARADRGTIELTTTGRKSGEPRKATIWFVVDGGGLFVQSGQGGKTDWYRNLRKDPRVKVDFGDATFTGKATPVEDAAEAKRVHELFRAKYWLARMAGWVGMGFGKGEVVRIDLDEAS